MNRLHAHWSVAKQIRGRRLNPTIAHQLWPMFPNFPSRIDSATAGFVRPVFRLLQEPFDGPPHDLGRHGVGTIELLKLHFVAGLLQLGD